MKCSNCKNEAVEGKKRCEKHLQMACETAKRYAAKNKEIVRARYKEWYDKNKEYARAYAHESYLKNVDHWKEYYLKNKERYAENGKKYQKNNAEKVKLRMRNWGFEYRAKNKEVLAERHRTWSENNREHQIARYKKYRSANPDISHKNNSIRRARQRGAFVAPVYKSQIYERDNWTCQICGEPANTQVHFQHDLYPSIDHIIPLSKGGTHEPLNVQCAHRGCNNRKQNKFLDETPEQLQFLADHLMKLALSQQGVPS